MGKTDLALIEQRIYTIRGVRVMLDRDLAKIYGVPTFRFNEAIKRNRHRFPTDFMFQLTAAEFERLKSQSANSSQIAISKRGRVGRARMPLLSTAHFRLQMCFGARALSR
jgi:ORF6N domain